MVTPFHAGDPEKNGPGRGRSDRDGEDGRNDEAGADAGSLSGAFDTLFCTLLQRLYRRASMLSGSRLSAEDAVHEVYLKLASRPEKLLRHPEPYAYAFAALMSVVKDTWRRERRQVLLEDLDQAAAPGAAVLWDGGVERRSSELEVVRLLGKLTAAQAGAVILVDLDGYTIDQAAEILGVHRGSVSRSRSRALRKLRGSLDQPVPAHASAADRTGRVAQENHEF